MNPSLNKENYLKNRNLRELEINNNENMHQKVINYYNKFYSDDSTHIKSSLPQIKKPPSNNLQKRQVQKYEIELQNRQLMNKLLDIMKSGKKRFGEAKSIHSCPNKDRYFMSKGKKEADYQIYISNFQLAKRILNQKSFIQKGKYIEHEKNYLEQKKVRQNRRLPPINKHNSSLDDGLEGGKENQLY